MTRKTSTTGPLAWNHAVYDIPASGLSAVRTATPDELTTIASALDLLGCTSLWAQYAIASTAGGHYRLWGRLRAELTQACVVTLEPVAGTVEETFEAVFWPQEDMPAPESGELAIDDEPEREAIVAGQIAAGRIVFESLAAALDPFPRQPGAVFDWQPASADDPAAKPVSPFAVLANLKAKD
jgi:uncharacterized metal-binding protein YceD (DUF177 family)